MKLGGRVLGALSLVGVLLCPSRSATAEPAETPTLTAEQRAAEPAETATVTAEQRAADAAEAAELFDEGRRAFENDELEVALARLSRAHALAPTYRTAAVLGQLELELAQHVLAATHLDESVRLFPRGTDPEGLGRVMDGLSEARRHIATLRVQSPTRSAELWIDGRRIGPLPLDRDLFIDPGPHQIEVRAPGHHSKSHEEHLPAGGSRDFKVVLEPAPQEPNASDAPATSSAAKTTLVAGSALTVLGLGVGVGFELAARSAESDARALGTGDCSGAAGALLCQRLRRHSDEARSHHDIASAAFISAGVVGVLTIATYALLATGSEEPARAEQTDSLALSPAFGPGTAGVSLTGGF